MKMDNKKLLTLLGIGTGGITTLALKGATMLPTKSQCKYIVMEVWDEIGDEIVSKLSLNKKPDIVFVHEDTNATMYVKSTRHTVGLFVKRIIRTESEYIVYVNIPILQKMVCRVNASLLRNVSKQTIKFLLCHECRHIYQAQIGFEVGQEDDGIYMDFINGYGNRPVEADANTWAVSMASNELEKILFKAHMESQNISGCVFADENIYKGLIKKISRIGFLL